MRNAKKTLSLVMIAIFTTFIVLSGIPAGAVTTAAAKAQVTKATAAVVKVEKTVKVSNFNPTTAVTQFNAANKEVAKVKSLGKTYTKTYTALAKRTATVRTRILARQAAVRAQALALAKAFADADKAVTAAEDAVDGDKVDLVTDEAALANAQGAVTAALEMVVKLNPNTANYKGLMARIDAANGLIVKAMDEIAAIKAEEEAAAAKKAAEEAAAKAEADAITAAETAVKATEDAVAAGKLTEALELGKVALEKIAAVKTPEKVAAFNARLLALAPAKIASVTAVDGTVTVNLDKAPLTTPTAADFKVTKAIGTTTPVAVTPTAVTVSNAVVTLAVPAVAQTAEEQSVVYNVAYTTGAAVAAAAYKVAAIPALAATATATNLREVVVAFNQEVDATTAETVGNYAGVTATAAVLGEDGKTVTLKVNALAQQTAYTLTVTGVKAAKTMLAPKVTADFIALDVTVPTVVDVKVTGPKELTLTFSETMKTVGTASLDNGAIYVTVPGGEINAKTLKLTLGTTLATGAHTIVLKNFEDYATFKTASQTITFNYAADTTLPTVVLTSADQTQAVFTFSKPVVKNTGFSVYHTFNKQAAYVGTADLDADGVTLTVTFATPIAAGNVTFFLNNATDTTALVDGWGNKFVTATLTTSITADTTAPTATITSTNNTTFKVVYSEPVDMTAGTNGATNKANYSVKDAAGTSVAITSVVSVDSKTATITVPALNGGSYNVTISNVNDKAIVPNKIVAVATPVAVTDVVNPKLASVVFSGVVNTTAAAAKILIKFNEPMNTTKLADKANYVWSVNGSTFKTLTADDTVTVGADGKSVTIALAAASFSDTASNNLIKFGPLTDVAGNPLADASAVVYPVGGLSTPAAIDTLKLVSAKATGTKTVVAKFNQPLTNAIAGDFVFNTSTAATTLTGSIVSITSDADGFGYVTFALNASLVTDATYGTTPAAVKLGTIASPTAEKSALGAVLTADTTGVTLADAIVPVVSTAKFTTTTAITLTMSEAMKAGTFASATLNGFSVSGGTLTSVALVGNNIVLTGTDFTADTTVSYNSVAGLTDVSDNAMASFSAMELE